MAGDGSPPCPRVSIITPSYMRAGSIRMCLESVARQDYPDIEHIVVDGGSDDGTVDILREYEQTRGIQWVSEPDGGMYEAINKGLSMASGEIVAYLNTDDAYFPWTVRCAVETLQRSQADAVFGDLLLIDQQSQDTTVCVQFYETFDMFWYTFVTAIGQPTMFWRRRVTDLVGLFSSDYRLIADCEYWLRMGASNMAIVHIPEVLALQVNHEDTLREVHAEQLAAEFRRLRDQYAWTARTGPSRNRVADRVRRSVRWRLRNASLLWLWARGGGRRWVHFVEFLRAGGVPFPIGFAVLSLLPSGMRRFSHRSLIADGEALSQLMAGAVGTWPSRFC